MVRHFAAQAPIAELGNVIARARVQAGLNQSELADALGIEQSSVSQWERGVTTPTLVMFRRMAAVVGPWPLLEALLPPTQDTTTAVGGPTNQRTEQPGPKGPTDQQLSRPMIGQRDGLVTGTLTACRPAEAPRSRRPSSGRPPKQELVELVDAGLSDRRIGQRYGVSIPSVRAWRRQYQLRRSSPSERPPKQKLARLMQQGLSDRRIGDRYGVSATTVANWRRAYELPRPQQAAVDPAKVLELWRQGLTIHQIAERLSRSHWTIRRLLQDTTLTYQAGTQPPTIPAPATTSAPQPATQPTPKERV